MPQPLQPIGLVLDGKLHLCSGCKTRKPMSEFYADASRGSGFSSRCKPCAKEFSARWQTENREQRNETSRRNPNLKATEFKAKLKYRFGLTVEQYDAMLAKQGGVCAICKGTNPTGKRLFVDHSHQTGVVRGLLCASCNLILGHVELKPSFLDNVEAYLHGGV